MLKLDIADAVNVSNFLNGLKEEAPDFEILHIAESTNRKQENSQFVFKLSIVNLSIFEQKWPNPLLREC